MSELKIKDIAKICHEANRALCVAQGDYSQVNWNYALQWQKQSCINSVIFRINNPDVTFARGHDNWMAAKIKDGWIYGEIKDADKKTHPSLVLYNELPKQQKAKDYLFYYIVNGLKQFLKDC